MIKKQLLLIIISLLLILSSCAASKSNNIPIHSNLTLIAFVSEWDEWNPINGIPHIFLYNDGTVIFDVLSVTEYGIENICKQKKLPDNKIKHLIKQLGPTNDFMDLDEDYFLDSASIEAPSYTIYLSDIKNEKSVTVHGIIEENKQLVPNNSKESRKDIPKEFNRVYELLTSIPFEGAKDYKPKYIRAFLQLVKDPKIKTIPWPKGLPDLNDKYTVSFYKDTYSINIPFTKSEKFKKYLLKLKKSKKLILLDGKKWSIQFRPVLPHENIGSEALKETKD